MQYYILLLQFQNLSVASDTISDQNWDIFQELGVVKDTVEKASEAEITPDIKSMVILQL